MTTTPSPLASAMAGEAPEVSVSRDLVRRGLWAAPVLVAASAALWGADGAMSAMFAIALILVNFLLSAASIAYTARISLSLMMGVVLGGYLVRLGLITVAVLLVKDLSWVSLPAMGTMIIVTHLGLLLWELKYIAASLAFPGLKPNRQHSVHPSNENN